MHGQDIPWLLAHWAEHRPDHPVLVWDPPSGDGREWTYRELQEDTHRLAAGLVGHGVAKGDKVLIHADNCPELVLAWLACATVGAVGVTTNTKSVMAELAYFIDKAQCVAAITQPRYAPMVVAAGPDLRWVAVTAADSDESEPADLSGIALEPFDGLFGDAADWQGRPAEPLLPFGIMFTSGTTNKPKAVVHTHANAVWASRLGPRNIDLGPDDRYLVYLPFFHVNAQSWTFFPVLGVGATVVLTPKWSTSRFWDVVARQSDHPHLPDAVRDGNPGPARPTGDAAPGRRVRAHHARPRPHVRDRRLRRLRHDRAGVPRHHRQTERAPAHPVHGARGAGLRARRGRQGHRRTVRRGPDR